MNAIAVDMNKNGVRGSATALGLTFDCIYLLDLESVVHKQISVYMIYFHLTNAFITRA
jgi:hypothetical protein